MLKLKIPALKAQLQEHRLEIRPLILIAAIFFGIAIGFGWHRYFTFYASFDQGIFNQVFWNGLHGNFFQSSLSSSLSTNTVHDQQIPAVDYHRLGQHFTPALLLWLPIYALVPSPATLTFIQVSLITAAGFVLYALGRHYLPPAPARWIVGGYFASNAVIGPVFSNFHDLCQIPLFIFTLLLAWEKRIWWLVWVMAGLTVLVREDAGVVLFGVGFYLIASRRDWKVGLGLCGLSFGYILLATNVLMPLFSQDISRRFMMEQFGHYVTSDRASTVEILAAMVNQPWRVLAHIFKSPEVKLHYLLVQSASLAFVPLISPVSWAIMGFPFLQMVLQKGQAPLAIHIRYAITVVPGLCYGAILWWSRWHQQRFRFRFRRFWAGCIALSLIFAFIYNPHRTFYFVVPVSFRPLVYTSLPRQWQHSVSIRQFIHQIPTDASVAATTYIVPHVSSRRAALRSPMLCYRDDQQQVQDVEYILADLWQGQQYFQLFTMERQEFRDTVGLIDQVLSQNRYGIIGIQDGIVFLQKGVTSQPTAIASWKMLRQEYEPLLRSLLM
jgi:uncharacterized membrane protein